MKLIAKYGLVITLFGAILIPSCRKSDRDKDVNSHSSRDHAHAEMLFNDIWKQVHDFSIGHSLLDTGSTDNNGSCSDTSYISSGTGFFPATLVIDYGKKDISCNDGNLRKGKIIATFSGKYRDPSTVITMRPYAYHLNGIQIEGVRTVTNRGTNPSGNLNFSSNLKEGTISGDSLTIRWEASHVVEWKQGVKTVDAEDDVFEMTGSGNGRANKGNEFTFEITDPLHWALNCPWIRSGTLSLTPGNLSERIVDYGSSGCDNKLTVTIIGKEHEVTVN